TPADNERAGAIWTEGLAAYPDSALLQTKLAWSIFLRPYMYFRGDPAAEYARAGGLVRSALAQRALSPLEQRLAHWLFAYVSAQEGEYDRALREMEITLSLGPYDAFSRGDLTTILILAGQPGRAVTVLDEVIAADTANRAFYLQLKGWALTVAGRHAESVTALNESIDLLAVPLLQAINYVHLGRLDEARAEVRKALQLEPDLTQARWRSANFYRDRAILEAQIADLAQAGLP